MKFFKTLVIGLFVLGFSFAAQAQEIRKVNMHDLTTIADASKGRVLVVTFWATWCAPCVKEFPGLVALRKQFSETELDIIGISVDSNPVVVQNFLKKNPANFPIYLDDGDISHALSIRSIPRTLIFNRNGDKVLDHLGFLAEESLVHVVDKVRQMP